MKIAIIQYNAGNIQSVLYALERIGVDAVVTDSPEEIFSADKVIFPGVGEASSAMNYLKSRNLDQVITALKQPVLGICLGMQLMCRHSEENDTVCLNIFPVEVKRFQNDIGSTGHSKDSAIPAPNPLKLKVPQMGWNQIAQLQSPLFSDIAENEYVYFVHSYYAELCSNTVAQTQYILPYSSALQKDNFYGVQFHPEKSAAVGTAILKNFLEKC
jgi:glutamine amidotransferase